MNPGFGNEFDEDLDLLWNSDTTLNIVNDNDQNNFYTNHNLTNLDFSLPPLAPPNQYCPQYQENYLPSVETAPMPPIPELQPLPIRSLRNSKAKKLSFSSASDTSSSSMSFDYSSEESFVPSTPPKRQKRANRSKSTPMKKAPSPSSPRGRGRPKKEDDDFEDDKLIHKRKYARAYREQHQQAVKNYQLCAMDFYNTLVESGVNVKKKFPQHSKIIQKISEKMSANKSTATTATTTSSKAASRRRY